MHALDLLKKPDSITTPPVSAVVGEDPFLKSEVVRVLLKGALGQDAEPSMMTRFAGDSASLAEVLDELRTVAMFEPRRFVLVDAADPFVTAHRANLEKYVQSPVKTGVLVLCCKVWPARTRLAAFVEQAGLTIDTRAPKEKELLSWMAAWSKARGKVKLDDDAARLLVELIGPEIGLLVSEIEKLSTYVGTKAHIRRADVATLVGAGRVESIWQILNAATVGQAREALTEIDRLIASGEHPVGLLAAMSASLRKVYHAGALRLRRVDAAEACRMAGIPPFATTTTLQQHRHLGPERVNRLPHMLLKADLDMKGNSPLPPRVILERLILELARPRADQPAPAAPA